MAEEQSLVYGGPLTSGDRGVDRYAVFLFWLTRRPGTMLALRICDVRVCVKLLRSLNIAQQAPGRPVRTRERLRRPDSGKYIRPSKEEPIPARGSNRSGN